MKLSNPKIKQLLEKYELIASLEQLSALAYWDLETYMPDGGASNRAQSLAKVSSLIQKLHLDDDFVKYAEEASNEPDLNDAEKGIIRILRRTLYHYYKVPAEFLEEFTKVTNKSQLAWREAREKNDFEIFAPHLKKIVEMTIQQAEYLEYANHPYDALLDIYEEELTTLDVEEYFNGIRPVLSKVLYHIQNSKKYSGKIHPIQQERLEKEEGEFLNKKLLEYFNYPKGNLRLDVSTHPFSQGINSKDVRITTRYSETDFASTFSSTIHEFGHALYELQVNKDYDFSPISKPISLIIHESQSRFWENIVGRNREFIKMYTPRFKKINENFKKYTPTDYYQYFNNVRPSLIRTESDEVTYHFHIMIRFEVEKLMIEKAVSVNELPELWAEKYKEYLGIKPRSFKDGILQDIHWSMGAIGYFPTYSMGTILANYWADRIEMEVDLIDNLVRTQDGIMKIQKWLGENIHTYSSAYSLKQLLEKKFKTTFDVLPWARYLENKYKELY